jgi:hypothetical protein
MKKAGVLLIALGIFSLFLAFNMDVVIGTSYNIGLLNERQNIVYLSGVLFLAGIMLFGFGVVAKEESKNLKIFAFWMFLTPIALIVTIKIVYFIKAEQIKQAALNVRKAEQEKQLAEFKINLDKFVDNKDGTVTFKANGLTWQKCSVGQTWNGETCSGEATEMTWSDAMSLSSNFYGYNDWRFPTVDELKTLIFCSDNEYKIDGSCTNSKEVTKPTIDLVYFSNMPKYSSYWSSSPYIGDNSLAYVVHFGFGNSYLGTKYDNHYFVRWVRYSHHDK